MDRFSTVSLQFLVLQPFYYISKTDVMSVNKTIPSTGRETAPPFGSMSSGPTICAVGAADARTGSNVVDGAADVCTGADGAFVRKLVGELLGALLGIPEGDPVTSTSTSSTPSYPFSFTFPPASTVSLVPL